MNIFPILNDENYFNDIYNEYLLDESTSFNELIYPISLSNLFKEINEERPRLFNNNRIKKIFEIKKKKNSGRKRKKPSEIKKHSSLDNDNILCKIQVHYLNFLVNFANDAIKTESNKKELKNMEFKHIMHNIKRQISSKSIQILIEKSLNEILQLNISKKYRKYSLDEDYNRNVYNIVITYSNWLKKLFDMNYLDAFKLYYNDGQPLNYINFENETIKFSKKTKSFYYLYKGKKIKEEEKNRVKFMAENYYLKLRSRSTFKVELFNE